MLGLVAQLVDRVGPSVEVSCDICGGAFKLGLRNEYRHRKAGTRPRCTTCRRPPVPMTDEERKGFQRWWIESSGLDRGEVLALAEVLAD